MTATVPETLNVCPSSFSVRAAFSCMILRIAASRSSALISSRDSFAMSRAVFSLIAAMAATSDSITPKSCAMRLSSLAVFAQRLAF